MKPTSNGPLPMRISGEPGVLLPEIALDACPGSGNNYPDLCASVFGMQPRNWLIGCYRKTYVGYSEVPEVRRAGASGGVITQILTHLLENDLIDGAVVVRQACIRGPGRLAPS